MSLINDILDFSKIESGKLELEEVEFDLADSHMNAYIRFKWTLTEWSEVVDAKTLPIESSLAIIDGLHQRWAGLITHLDDGQMNRTYFHPELASDVSLYEALPSYVWHTNHHTAQIRWIREQRGW